MLCDGYIADEDFNGEIPEECKVIDATGLYVSAGFIDMHVHGGGGYDVMDCTSEALKAISKIHLEHGATTILPTAVSAPISDTLKFLETYKSYASECENFCGVHIEGPYISVNQKGAHKAHLLHAPQKQEIDKLLEQGKGVLKRITAAPSFQVWIICVKKPCRMTFCFL